MCRTCDDADLSVQHVLYIVPWLIIAVFTIWTPDASPDVPASKLCLQMSISVRHIIISMTRYVGVAY